ncbi:NTP transferase domain-containing protein [Caulobacter sp. NIBR2454]|uniref:NTP transferase domain-containing protein n=1 Tax=Caulobacter sp. NIBR2454 TaxID=3015996 RepID=UPI0022B65C8B|nr:NTP transferase domain-containing protein [Caulobacter sp. NIBR2454]
MSGGFTALVLAGDRGEPDAVSAYAGVAHKGLIVLEGETLLARVLAALAAAGATRIGVCADNAELLAALPAATPAGVAVEVIAPEAGPSLSVYRAAQALGTPLLVTTVDHALLQADWVKQFLADAPTGCDIAALLAPEAAVRRDAPQTQRTWLTFRDGRYSGCNLFLLRTPDALKAIELWRTVEAHRKRPWRIAMILGLGTLLRFALGRLTLDQAITDIGRRAGVKAAAVRSNYGLAAVDVDKPADLDLVRQIVEA